jgi:hypothetical protein
VTAISNFLHRDLVRTKVDLIIASYFFGCISGCIVRNARKAAEFAKKDSVSIGQSIAKLAILVKINAMKFCQRFKSFIAAAADYIVASVAKVASFAATSGEKTARQFGAVTAKVSDFTQRKAAEAVKRFRVALAKAGKIFSRDWVRTGADMVVVANFFRHLCSSFAQNVKKMPIFLKNHLKNNAPGAGKFQLRKIFHSAAVEIRKNFSRACRESKQLLRRIASFLLRYIAAVRRDLAAFRNFINGKIWLPAAWLLKLVWPALKFLLYIPAKLDCHFNALGNRMEEKLMNFFSNAGQRTALGLQRAYSAATRPAMAFGVIFAASLFIGLRVYDSQMLKIECGRAELDVKKSRELLINRDKPKQMIGYITQNAVPKQHTRIERASSVRAAKDVDEFRQAVDAFFSEHRVSEIIYMNGACRMKIDDRVVNDLNSLGRGRSGVEMFIADSDGEIITFADSYGNRYAKQIASLFN